MTEQEKRMYRVCFTGHRPEKLLQSEQKVCFALEQEIRKAIEEHFTVFISGMARGVDIWAAEIVLKLRNEGFSIRLICASPFEGFERSWSSDWQMRYQAILNNADLVRYVCPNYSSKCFQIRNEWMVNHSARVIAVYNGEPGGTRNTVCYAKMHGVDVVFACS